MDLSTVRKKFEAVTHALTEYSRRMWAASEAMALGRGGLALVHRATGIACSTIARGIDEIKSGAGPDPGRTRRMGGGRKRTVDTDLTLASDLESLVEPTVSGDPMGPLRWTCKSVRKLAEELRSMGHTASHRLVARCLHEADYSLQANRKTKESKGTEDRDAQFRYISRLVRRQQRAEQPVVSVDTKKKELVGDFKNPGREWRPKGQPERVRVHDFILPDRGKAIPYGVYDLTLNEGWVSVGIDHDTASFAVSSIARWWNLMGKPAYRGATSLLITADAGGSNGTRTRLWKRELQRFADVTSMSITVSHFPPGTSKWNKIEHRLFSYISMNWRGKPLVSLAAIVSLIGSTRTGTGLRVRCEIDKSRYPLGVVVTDEEMNAINLERHRFQGSWNYTIHPAK